MTAAQDGMNEQFKSVAACYRTLGYTRQEDLRQDIRSKRLPEGSYKISDDRYFVDVQAVQEARS